MNSKMRGSRCSSITTFIVFQESTVDHNKYSDGSGKGDRSIGRCSAILNWSIGIIKRSIKLVGIASIMFGLFWLRIICSSLASVVGDNTEPLKIKASSSIDSSASTNSPYVKLCYQSQEKEDKKDDDWNEEDYIKRMNKLLSHSNTVTSVPNYPKNIAVIHHKSRSKSRKAPETRVQIRKRVARQMEEEANQTAPFLKAPPLKKKNETKKQMRARVARQMEEAANRQKKSV